MATFTLNFWLHDYTDQPLDNQPINVEPLTMPYPSVDGPTFTGYPEVRTGTDGRASIVLASLPGLQYRVEGWAIGSRVIAGDWADGTILDWDDVAGVVPSPLKPEDAASVRRALQQMIEDGVAGPVGPQGPQGLPGAKGDPGEPGTDGIDGIDGPQGPVGQRGEKGTTGDTGPQGPQGLPGINGTNGADGATGTKGDPGERGPTGPQGEVGPQGPTGADSTVPGPKGDPGDPGADGVPGADGAPGPIGPEGDPGDSALLVQVDGAYPPRPFDGPAIFIGDLNPETLGLMLDGDSWISDDEHSGFMFILDTDGVPYLTSIAGTPGASIQYDIDGTPYFTIGL